MTRVALIAVFAVAIFLGAVAAFNQDYFIGSPEGDSKAVKTRKANHTGEAHSGDCTTCPLPTN